MPEHVLMSEVEIIKDGGRRRRWSATEKLRIVEETLDERTSISVVARRFATCHAPSLIEMLSDNGPPYIAKQTQIFARQLGLKPCFTPVQSPQSNGISEAFVKRP